MRLVDALHTSDCYWSILDDDEWDARKEAHLKARDGKVTERKKCNDAGLSAILKQKRADLARHGND